MLLHLIQVATDPLGEVLLGSTDRVIFFTYILVREIFPKVFPQLTKLWGKKISTEDRLFNIIQELNKQQVALTIALEKLTNAITNKINTPVP